MAAPGVRSWNDEQAELLRRMFPDWDIWYVIVYLGPDSWCAKPKGHEIATVNRDSPGQLAEAIREQSQAPSLEQ